MRFDEGEDRALLEAFAKARVADVRDGMDVLGYHFFGSMNPTIRPLWRARAVGIARTARYLPFRGRVPELACDDYHAWSGRYYNEICTYPWVNELREGDFVVIDASGVDAGLMGSENTLACLRRGARGLVTNGGVRDTDEVVLQRVPFWSAMTSKAMVQGRLQFDAHDVPVAVGGVAVMPGDVVVADGDGVIVVPREIAVDVAREANAEHGRDKANRARHYQALGRGLDETVI
jgi:regulator of RNase E activity RraA